MPRFSSKKLASQTSLLGVGVSQSFEKRGGAITVKVNGANKGSDRVKGSWRGGRRRPNEQM
jgi:hypothetical protein